MSIESVPLEGAVMLRDSTSLNGEPVLFALLRTAANLVVATTKGRRSVLERRYPQRITQSTQFVYHSRSSTSLPSLDWTESLPSGSVVVLDGVDILVETLGVDRTSALVHRIKAKCCVCLLCPRASVDNATWLRLSSVADASFELSLNQGTPMSRSLVYRRNGKTQQMTESFSVNADLRLSSRRWTDADESVTSSTTTAAADDLTTQFDMGLSLKSSERSARDALQLPYISAENQQGLVLLRESERKVRVGGQVIYSPDDGDDLDDSDPDDDLCL